MKSVLTILVAFVLPMNAWSIENNDTHAEQQTISILSCLNHQADLDKLQCFDNLFIKKGPATTEKVLNTLTTEVEGMQSCTLLSTMSDRLVCFTTIANELKHQTQSRVNEKRDASLAQIQEDSAGNGQEINATTASKNPIKLFTKPKTPPSFIMQSWQLVAQTDRGPFVITPYKPTYVLPLSYSHKVNDQVFATLSPDNKVDNVEMKFQLSFKAKIWPDLFSSKGDFWFAYTQTSYWQAYNQGASAIFRETNYEPELFYSWKSDVSFLGINNRLLLLSLNHQSNGRGAPLSRSWNRVVASAFFDIGNDFAVVVKTWYRLKDSSQDDNPDIEEYLGRGELSAYWKRGRNNYTIMLRSNLDDNNRVGIQMDWSHSISRFPVKPYIQYFYGYGDSLIEYNFRSNRISFGLLLTDWF